MSDVNAWTILVTALDRASAPLRQIRTNMAAVVAPATNITKTIENIGEQSGLTALSEQAAAAMSRFEGLGAAVGGLAGPLGALGGMFAFGGLVELAKHSADYGEQVYNAEKKTGLLADQIARLHYVAEQNGGSVDQLDKALEFLNRTIGQAASGTNKRALAWFHAMHIDIRDGNHHLKDASTLWSELSDRFRSNASMAQKSAAATALFGRAGVELLPVLELGSDETRRLGDEFDRLHGKMTERDAANAKRLADGWRNLGIAAAGLGDAIGSGLEPYLMPVVKTLTDFASQHRDMAASLSGTALAIAGIALIAGPAGAALNLAAGGIGFLAKMAIFTVGPLFEFAQALGLGFTAMEAFDLAASANPFGLVVLGAIAVGAAAYEIYNHWGAVKDFFAGLWDYTVQAFKWGYRNILPWLPGGELVKLIVDNWSGISAFFEKTWRGIVDAFERNYAHIKPIVEVMAAVVQDVSGYSGLKTIGGLAASAADGIAAHGREVLNPSEPVVSPAISGPIIGGAFGDLLGRTKVQIDLNGLPPGSRVQAESAGRVEHELNVLNTGLNWDPSF